MKTIIAVIFLVFAMIIGLTFIEQERATFYYNLSHQESEVSSESSSTSTVQIKVIISGQVEKPGTYYVYSGSTLEELLETAGGETIDADDDCFNYDLVLTEDMSIYIAKENDYEKVSINEADSDELETISGIGSTIAGRIIEYRNTYGEFEYLEQLLNITGIGTSLFNKIKDKICL